MEPALAFDHQLAVRFTPTEEDNLVAAAAAGGELAHGGGGPGNIIAILPRGPVVTTLCICGASPVRLTRTS
jgi:hypothetical protein